MGVVGAPEPPLARRSGIVFGAAVRRVDFELSVVEAIIVVVVEKVRTPIFPNQGCADPTKILRANVFKMIFFLFVIIWVSLHCQSVKKAQSTSSNRHDYLGSPQFDICRGYDVLTDGRLSGSYL